ncbi:mRNA splicing factor, putative [Ricinus communis]|uniref:mRNA splicing factor, putative n=1 Tax=Ricinus communis TaxID=3988 RepID=B9SM97_RICCO|nr:mRNA splicing factor, putative [Ricinus communis]
MASSSQQRCVFVGNIPYDATEEQLIDICREVGPVVSFRLVIDRETGKPKGYGFCEYKDEETALSARRNLQGYEINGRQLRVDFAENDKNADRNREQGRGGPGLANIDPQKQIGGPAILGESAQHQPIGLHIAITAATVMAGALGGVQTGMQSNLNGLQSQSALASDPLTLHLAKMSRSQLNDIMSELKVMATQNKESARHLLLTKPQLPKALFQAQIMLGMVTPQVLQMPNIRQPPGQPAVRPLEDSQQGQRPAIQNVPGLPPFSQRIQSSLVPKLQEGQFSSVSQNSLVQNQFSVPPQLVQPRTQIQQHSNSHIPQQAILSGQSGVPPIPHVHPSVRPQIQVANSSSLNQQTPPSLLQQPGKQVRTANFGRASHIVLPNVAMESSIFPRPLQPDAAFQPGPPILSGISDSVGRGADRSTQVPDDTAQVHRNNAYFKMQTNMVNDSKEPINRPSKMLKLDDGRSMSFSSSALNVSKSGPTQSHAISSVPANSLPKPEELQTSEKQVSQA